MGYWVYILRCGDNSYYCGSTACLERRLWEHNEGLGAKYTFGRRPVYLEQAWRVENRSQGQKLEALIKKSPKSEKHYFVTEPELLLAKARSSGLEFTIQIQEKRRNKYANRPN